MKVIGVCQLAACLDNEAGGQLCEAGTVIKA